MNVHPPAYRAAITVLTAVLLMEHSARELIADPPVAKPAKSVTVRLVNITIPPDCRLRNSVTIARPPILYLELYENGTLIGTSSTVVRGWEIDFPEVKQNQWMIKQDSKTRYSIKVMDDNWWGDDLVFEITGCKGKDLQAVLRERGPVSEATDRLASIEFDLVSEAEGSGAPKAGGSNSK